MAEVMTALTGTPIHGQTSLPRSVWGATCPTCSNYGTYAAEASCGHCHMLPCRDCAKGQGLPDRACCPGRCWPRGCERCHGRGTVDIGISDAVEHLASAAAGLERAVADSWVVVTVTMPVEVEGSDAA